jgi:hypothetical protein
LLVDHDEVISSETAHVVLGPACLFLLNLMLFDPCNKVFLVDKVLSLVKEGKLAERVVP